MIRTPEDAEKAILRNLVKASEYTDKLGPAKDKSVALVVADMCRAAGTYKVPSKAGHAIRRGVAADLRDADEDTWRAGASVEVANLLDHSRKTANSDLASRYIDASTENSLRARQLTLPRLQPHEDGTERYHDCAAQVHERPP